MTERQLRAEKLVDLFKRCGYDAKVVVQDRKGLCVGLVLKDNEPIPVAAVSDIEVIRLPLPVVMKF